MRYKAIIMAEQIKVIEKRRIIYYIDELPRIYQEKVNKPVATVFADDNKKYLSTELANPIDDNKSYISNKIELLNYENIIWCGTTNRK